MGSVNRVVPALKDGLFTCCDFISFSGSVLSDFTESEIGRIECCKCVPSFRRLEKDTDFRRVAFHM